MPVRAIVTGRHSPVLRQKSQQVSAFNKELKKLIVDLLDTVEDAKGAGLAAPQIGVSQSVTVARLSGSFLPLINPEIIWESEITELLEEGCLSLPNVWLMVPRAREAIVRYRDEKGGEQERKLSGMDARVAQHEIDHLNGKLIVDYSSQP
jgi:peptide deformylase